MASYHLCVKPISRSAGRTATASAAYRAGCVIFDERTGEVHDYSRKRGVESAEIVLPDDAPTWAEDRTVLWNAVEKSEKRKDACVAREIEIALPCELSIDERRRLALDFAKEMANVEGCAIDVAIHAPSRRGDQRNHHAHLLRTTRKIGSHGMGDKLSTEKAGRGRREDLIQLRARWAELVNTRLHENGIRVEIDHRTLQEQGIHREPTIHRGPVVTAIIRRGIKSHIQTRIDAEVEERLRAARDQGERERRQEESVKNGIFILSENIIEDVRRAKQEREKRRASFDSFIKQTAWGLHPIPTKSAIRYSNENDMEP